MSYSDNQNRKSYILAISAVVLCAVFAVAVVAFLNSRQRSLESSITSSTSQALVTDSIPDSVYADGVYTNRTTYDVPREHVDVVDFVLEVEDDLITNFRIDNISVERESAQYIDAYEQNVELVGLKLEDVDSAFVSGASLTSLAFADAIQNIKTEAKQ